MFHYYVIHYYQLRGLEQLEFAVTSFPWTTNLDLTSMSLLIFFKISPFLLESQSGRVTERQSGRFSVRWFTPQVAAIADAMPI